MAAAPLAYRGLVGEWPGPGNGGRDDTRRALSGEKGIQVREAIRLEKPIDAVFRFWQRLENLPRSLLQRIERGEIDRSFIITPRIRLDDAPEIYKTFREKQDQCIKVVMRPEHAA